MITFCSRDFLGLNTSLYYIIKHVVNTLINDTIVDDWITIVFSTIFLYISRNNSLIYAYLDKCLWYTEMGMIMIFK